VLAELVLELLAVLALLGALVYLLQGPKAL
jgi:hypothetical protein